MAMSRDEFKEAFRAAYSMQFADIPTDESAIDYTFSAAFERKMQRLIRSQKHALWPLVNTVSKRVAMIVLTTVVLFAASLSIKAVREPIARFLVESLECFVRYLSDSDDTPPQVTQEYTLSYVPEGYRLEDTIRRQKRVINIYQNKNGNTIKFTQSIASDAEYIADIEKQEGSALTVAGHDVYLYERGSTVYALWTQDTYCFKIMTSPPLSLTELEAMIRSVAP